jgi:hypothetical protein
MSAAASLVDRLRPLLAERSIGQQLYVIALLESRAADRYRDWAKQVSDAALARGLGECAQREDRIAALVRKQFAEVIEQPADLADLAGAIQREVAALFGGRSLEEQFVVQAQAERGGEQLWRDLERAQRDADAKAVLLECAELEGASASFLERL